MGKLKIRTNYGPSVRPISFISIACDCDVIVVGL